VSERERTERRVKEACDAGSWSDAATAAIEGYGPEVLAYLCAVLRDEDDAADAFSRFCEAVWVGLPKFRWTSTLRTWAYVVAQHASYRELRDPHRKRGRRVPLSDAPVAALAERVKTTTLSALRSEVKDKLAEVRAGLEPEDQALLILRVDRQLPWRDVARVMTPEGEDDSVDALERRAAALRKRFERLKSDLRGKLRGA
jgi:RNA polymerase sigma-70 factor (ECF subfamily)